LIYEQYKTSEVVDTINGNIADAGFDFHFNEANQIGYIFSTL
jgi:hypothetical protein